MKDDKVKDLRLQAQSFSNAASFYGQIIENSQRSYLPSSPYMVNLVEHKSGLQSQQSHSIFKSGSQSCLGCDKVMTCSIKCDKL